MEHTPYFLEMSTIELTKSKIKEDGSELLKLLKVSRSPDDRLSDEDEQSYDDLALLLEFLRRR
jgi:hypothetical protein